MSNWLGLDDRVILVTGGASGIGKATAESIKEGGATVVIADMNVQTGDEIDGMWCVHCNVTDPDEVKAMVDAIVEKYGHIDGLFNNAGINKPCLLVDVRGDHPEYELDVKKFDQLFGVNVKGLFLVAQAVAKQMLKQGKGGVIVNTSSASGKEGSEGQSPYSATKGACDSFTRSWAKELGRYGIRVVAVAPDIMDATALRSEAYDKALAYTRGTVPEKMNTDYSKSVPLGRPGHLYEVGDLVAFLMSDHAGYITGTTINVSGGKSRG
ncbi:MAG: sorbitol-6-phosphate dehydrogenase subunit [Atopobiaceae bacterium]|jgi:sorbitol-6-phosphate 2-dehydrogenase|nr:sorbitol-6-phosphate dehydrogenase subunit [Atopobiaceae bacterium]MCH4119689.1 sorbitol-6-phosphate dehydrogenase subunit [Atopobiaceae bacterium]MCI1318815.1 sorbitol-6-phosphate dehydrogenase subunit [Atopobiaceae bacterium]MCI1388763.1 sorbitol-6-phosphate dehydrogenase subunit [Atopobiaceae bacterium]MCI1432617.1 sorbitol-6-phosphate dehydrogenase subunit [Atopobiaceae bacterium]